MRIALRALGRVERVRNCTNSKATKIMAKVILLLDYINERTNGLTATVVASSVSTKSWKKVSVCKKKIEDEEAEIVQEKT